MYLFRNKDIQTSEVTNPSRSPLPNIRLTEVRFTGITSSIVRENKMPMAMLPMMDLRAMKLVFPRAYKTLVTKLPNMKKM